MNIACTACSARYGVADEKLIGKRVKITCKRCGTVLIVDGNVSPPSVSASTSVAPGPASGRTSSSRAPKASPPPERPPEPPFVVAFSQDRQEEADVAQIVRLHRAGQLTPETLVWREGMADWVNPWDVEEIAAAFRKMGYARPTPAPAPKPRDDEETTHVADSGPMQSALFDDDEATQIVDSSRYNEQPLPSFGSSPASSPVSEDDEAATHVARSPISDSPARATQKQRESNRAQRRESTRAARRESTRPAAREQAEPARRQRTQRGGQDLFANQAHAGSEAEAMAVANAMADAVDEPRLTGARNENSVLFSLDALMQKELRSGSPAAPPQRSHRMEEALLVDVSGSLPGGGGIAPALAAPDFTAPITAPPPRFAPADVPGDDEMMPAPRRSKAGLVVLLLLGFVAIGGVGFAMGTGKLQPLLVKVGLAPPPAASEQVDEKPAPSASAAAGPVEPAASAEPVASASAAPGASATPGSEKPAAPATGIATAAPPPTGVAAASPAPAAAPGGGTPRAKPAETAAKEEPPAQTGFGAGAPFDAQAAKTALGGAAANASSCKEPGGPTGTGRVSITFAASGRPTSVAVTGDLAGTTVGSCVARLFRSARVPAFSGEPVTVSKTFSVQ